MPAIAPPVAQLAHELLAQGDALRASGQHAEAANRYATAVQIHPFLAEAHFNLGALFHGQGKLEEAKACYRNALSAEPGHAGASNNLGVLLAAEEKTEEAAQCYRDALARHPDAPELHNNLAALLRDLGRIEEAMVFCVRALELDPGFVEAHNNLGNLHKARNRFAEALACYQKCLSLRPNYPEALNNLGTTFAEMGDLARAIACYRKALALKPDSIDAHNNLANNLLMLGEFSEGWREYQWRRMIPRYRGLLLDVFPKPAWDGAPLDGKHILLVAEQGYGDAIQFARYAPLVAARGGEVILACQPALHGLMARLEGVSQVVNQRGPWPGFHEYAPLLCLPRIFGHDDVLSFPRQTPYLAVDPARLEAWRPRLPDRGRLRVGLVWAGSPSHGRDHLRSIPLEKWRAILAVPGVDFYSLQLGEAVRGLAGLPPGQVRDLSPEIKDFSDTAAILCHLDLLISIDSSPIHLAGALGRPVWALITFTPDWRWLLQREDSPWYPTMRLFRQRQPAVWDDVMARVCEALTLLARRRGPVTAPAAAISTGSLHKRRVAITWQLSQQHGWGLYGLNLALSLLRLGGEPVLLQAPVALTLNPLQQRAFDTVMRQSRQFYEFLEKHPQRVLRDPQAAVLLSSDQNLNFRSSRFQGGSAIGLTFFENPNLPPESIQRAADIPLIVTGSTWNEKILRDKFALTRVRTILQGVDTALFHPSTRSGLLPGKFVIFGGGKLEHRKGQDLVITAFRRFHARHPEAFLLTNWHNHWVQQPGMREAFAFRSQHLQGLPATPDLNAWLATLLPAGSFFDVGPVSNPMIPPLLREADVAVMPSRCEGGTNLVAMECMAIGLPVLLSANTGHLDLIGDDRCYPLRQQTPCRDLAGVVLEGWGESSVEEMVEALEEVYRNREEARLRGVNAHRFLGRYSWGGQCEQVLRVACGG